MTTSNGIIRPSNCPRRPTRTIDTRTGSVRVTSGLQSDLTNTVPDVSPSRAEALPKLLSPLTDACVEAVEAIADDERRPIASLLSTPEPDAKTGVHHLADEYGIDAGNGSFGAAVVDAARHDHVPEDIREELPQYGTGQSLEDTNLDALRRGHCAPSSSGRCDADTARRVRRRRMDDAGGSPEGRALLRRRSTSSRRPST